MSLIQDAITSLFRRKNQLLPTVQRSTDYAKSRPRGKGVKPENLLKGICGGGNRMQRTIVVRNAGFTIPPTQNLSNRDRAKIAH